MAKSKSYIYAVCALGLCAAIAIATGHAIIGACVGASMMLADRVFYAEYFVADVTVSAFAVLLAIVALTSADAGSGYLFAATWLLIALVHASSAARSGRHTAPPTD